MRKLYLRDNAGDLEPNANTEREFDQDVKIEEVNRVLSQLSAALKSEPGKACYVFGMGAQPESTYAELSRISGVNLIFCRSILPKKFSLLRFIIASYEGLFKIEDKLKISEVFLRLADSSMVGLYVFDNRMEHDFIKNVKKELPRTNYDFGIKEDDGYILYVLDADSDESPSGMIELVSFGKNAIWKGF
jgi:hypothetical protein